MPYDLRREPWIPWRRADGTVVWGAPALLVHALDSPGRIVGIAAPRPDLEGALQEFLIGLLSAALAPADLPEWRALRDRPPSPDALQAALDALPDAFDLDGDGARFFQDGRAEDLADIEPSRAEQLLIDTPGDNAIRRNTDLFVKRERAHYLGRPAAAMALLTLQTYAPSGGQGHRTSLRGGGPLTTLVDPRVDAEGADDPARPLWEKLWANVETVRQWRERTPPGAPTDLAAAFPWLHAPRSTSNEKQGGASTSPAQAHALEAYFGVPRRIRLEFGGEGVCGLTGRPDARVVTGFRMRNYGAQYVAWQHPLSPYYRAKASGDWLPLHGQPGGVGWRDWIGLALEGNPEETNRKPAAVVSAYHRRAGRDGPARLHVFGYDMDNMKARGWTEATLPLLLSPDAERRERLRIVAARLVEGTALAADQLLRAVKQVLFGTPTDTPGDLGHVRDELWAATGAHFFAVMRDVARADAGLAPDEAVAARARFARDLARRALALFDRWCPPSPGDTRLLRRRVLARSALHWTLEGRSKQGETLFRTLDIPLPEGGMEARRTARRARKEATT